MLHFAYPDENVDPKTIPNLAPMPDYAAPVAEHTKAQALWSKPGHRLIPLSEEGTVALHASKLVPLRTFDRCLQMGWLRACGVTNVPEWQGYQGFIRKRWPWDGPTWVKSAFSTLGQGVRRVDDFDLWALAEARGHIIQAAHSHHSLVRKFTRRLTDARWMAQRHVEGPQYEVNAAIAGGDVLYGPCLRQVWEGSEIVEYLPAPSKAEGLHDLVAALVLKLDLRWTFLNVEVRETARGEWMIIELHLRPGDDRADKGYPGHEWVPLACRWMLLE